VSSIIGSLDVRGSVAVSASVQVFQEARALSRQKIVRFATGQRNAPGAIPRSAIAGAKRSCSLCRPWEGKVSKRKGQGRTLRLPTGQGKGARHEMTERHQGPRSHHPSWHRRRRALLSREGRAADGSGAWVAASCPKGSLRERLDPGPVCTHSPQAQRTPAS
jgi:hypothetical protein